MIWLLADALRDLAAFERRYVTLTELGGLLDEMARVRARIARQVWGP